MSGSSAAAPGVRGRVAGWVGDVGLSAIALHGTEVLLNPDLKVVRVLSSAGWK